MKDTGNGSNIEDRENLKMIQTRKEYVESILNDFGSGQILPEKLVGELTQEIKNLYAFTETVVANVTKLKSNYEFLLNIIISMPEIQNNVSLTKKIKERFTENSHP
jgi:archaellum component FlaC